VCDAGLGAARLRSLLDAHRVRPSRALGQNFVIDPNTLRRVVDLSGVGPSDRVLEVGPGAGSLTILVARSAGSVVAIELDRALLPVLSQTLAGLANVEVLAGDALHMDLSALGVNRLVANLPYGIAASLVVKVLREVPAITSLTVMVQREVGARLAARPGSKSYGAASVIVSLHAAARVVMNVSRRAFYPVPRVDSVVVRLDRRPPPPGVDPDLVADVVHAAFAQRRKTLRNALARLTGSTAGAETVLRDAGVDPRARAEEVDLAGYAAITQSIAAGTLGATRASDGNDERGRQR
jgi:16S rRNA (adenine1518-N6/adenine1519-N6)-dimethyltransferase